MEEECQKNKTWEKIEGPLADFLKSLGPGVWINDDCPLQSFMVRVDKDGNVFREALNA